jgi:anti-sigma B factor antagonist
MSGLMTSSPPSGLPSGVHTVTLSGDLDLFSVPLAAEALEEALAAGSRDVVVDLVGVTFVDSKALGVLLRARHLLVDAGRGMILLIAGPTIEVVLRRLGVADLFDVRSVPPEAAAASEDLERTLRAA